MENTDVILVDKGNFVISYDKECPPPHGFLKLTLADAKYIQLVAIEGCTTPVVIGFEEQEFEAIVASYIEAKMPIVNETKAKKPAAKKPAKKKVAKKAPKKESKPAKKKAAKKVTKTKTKTKNKAKAKKV